MKKYMPDYYKDFQCIAGKCKDNCCIGWDIVIDDQTYEKYQEVETPFKQRLKDGIKEEHQFCLTDQGRCVFLNEKNLCDIYLELGEDALCEICTQHPRFHNEYGHIKQSGLGIACEEAAHMVLMDHDLHIDIEEIEESDHEIDEWADELMMIEMQLLEVLNKKENSIEDRMNKVYDLAATYQEKLNLTGEVLLDPEGEEIHSYEVMKKIREKDYMKYWFEFYEDLDYMDEKFRNFFKKIGNNSITEYEEDAVYKQRLMSYFIYRHFIKSYEDDNLLDKVKFAILSTEIISYINQYCKTNNLSFTPLEIAKMYSKEIEYSEDNMDAIFEELLFV